MNKLFTLFISVVIGSIIAGSNIRPAFAMASNSNGLAVSPAISNITLISGQTSTSIKLSIANITGNTLGVAVTDKDFTSLNNSGSIGFYGSSYKPSNNPHGLSATIDLPVNEIYIPPHQSKSISVTLNNLNSLAPGGHYGALLFTPFIAVNGAVKNQINVRPSVASLIFLTTASGGTQSIKLQGLSTPTFGFDLPTLVYATLQNTGNTQVTPTGVVSLTNPSKGVVSQTIINSNSGMILPNTTRLFSVSLNSPTNIFRASGIYQIKFKFRIAGTNGYQTEIRNYLYINPAVLLSIIIFILIIIGIAKNSSRLMNKPMPSSTKKHFSKKS